MINIDPIKTHRVTKTTVTQQENGEFAVKFEFDDGSKDFATVGIKAAAEFYARVQLQEDLVVASIRCC